MIQLPVFDYMCLCGHGLSNAGYETVALWTEQHLGEGHGPVDY